MHTLFGTANQKMPIESGGDKTSADSSHNQSHFFPAESTIIVPNVSNYTFISHYLKNYPCKIYFLDINDGLSFITGM